MTGKVPPDNMSNSTFDTRISERAIEKNSYCQIVLQSGSTNLYFWQSMKGLLSPHLCQHLLLLNLLCVLLFIFTNLTGKKKKIHFIVSIKLTISSYVYWLFGFPRLSVPDLYSHRSVIRLWVFDIWGRGQKPSGKSLLHECRKLPLPPSLMQQTFAMG